MLMEYTELNMSIIFESFIQVFLVTTRHDKRPPWQQPAMTKARHDKNPAWQKPAMTNAYHSIGLVLGLGLRGGN